jgi:hypothetical protein
MNVTEINTQRFKVALDLLREGRPLTFDSVTYFLANEKILSVSIESSWELENLTDDRALGDLQLAKSNFAYLLRNFEDFRVLVSGLQPSFHLVRDYGTGAVELASLSEDALVWNPFLKNKTIR